MIKLIIGEQVYFIRWNGKEWKDKAGHVWTEFGQLFKNPIHGVSGTWETRGDRDWSGK